LIFLNSATARPGNVASGAVYKREIEMGDMTTDKLMHELKAVVSDAEELLKATAGQGGEQLARIRARAEESVRTARTRMKDAGVQVDEQVRENPWTAIGIAAGVGLVLGILLGRK
jgi:ElaB/YqjD/DUF883 family membrane-anchored ribosome-binding protein